MSKIPISVCIIAKNEEKHIGECLKRLKPYGFEIIVTDTGSTDRTKEIAEKYADKVLDFEWINDFSAARNFCASHASNNWILALDCDEYMANVNISELRQYMQQMPRSVGIIRLKNMLIDDNGQPWYNTDDIPRMYNRNYYVYDRAIHEQITQKKPEDRTNSLDCFIIPTEVIHHGYALSDEEMAVKQKRNLDLLMKKLETETDTLERSYTLFQIGQSCFNTNRLEEAVKYYEEALTYDIDMESSYGPVLVISLAKVYNKLGRRADALAHLDKYAERIKTAKFVYMHACEYLENDQPLKALLYFVKTTLLPDVDTLGKEKMSCYANIINLYMAMGDEKMADVFKAKYEECEAEWERVKNA